MTLNIPSNQKSISEKKEKAKAKKKKWRIKQYGVWFKIDREITMESDMLRVFRGSRYFEHQSLNIKRAGILVKALDFCRKRGQLRLKYASDDDENLLHELKEFDSRFLQQAKATNDIIDLIDAAAKLEIKSLFNLLFDDVVDMIAHKAPQDIDNIFNIRYKNEDDFKRMNSVMDDYLEEEKVTSLL